jgi:ferric-dicitrate binding protein FerR (iron transport regulator)
VLNKILGKEENETTAPAPVYNFSERKRTWEWKRIAAAAAIFVFVGAALFYSTSGEKVKDTAVLKKEGALPAADITPPNSANAILTLANGQTIILDSAGNGTLARQGAVTIIKLADGQITYDPQAGAAQGQGGEITYNTLTNPAGSRVVNLILEDGTKVWLNSKSSLRYPTAFTEKERNVEITGEAYFEVSRISSASVNGEASTPFHVNVSGIDVQVLGTHFNINSYDEEGSVKTTLLEGSVKVSKDRETVLLKPGQQAQITLLRNTAPIRVNTPDLEEVMAWKNGKFSFHNTSLDAIMRETARWYNVEVVYKDKINDHYTVNVPRNVPVSQLFKFIEMSGGVHFSIEGNKIMVKK